MPRVPRESVESADAADMWGSQLHPRRHALYGALEGEAQGADGSKHGEFDREPYVLSLPWDLDRRYLVFGRMI